MTPLTQTASGGGATNNHVPIEVKADNVFIVVASDTDLSDLIRRMNRRNEPVITIGMNGVAVIVDRI